MFFSGSNTGPMKLVRQIDPFDGVIEAQPQHMISQMTSGD